MRLKRPISSGSGAVPGTRMWTRTGSVMAGLLLGRCRSGKTIAAKGQSVPASYPPVLAFNSSASAAVASAVLLAAVRSA